MWLSESHAHAGRRAVLMALAGLALLLAAGCSGLTPVYGGLAGDPRQAGFAYAEPADRLSQVVLQELALRLGTASGPDVPLLRIEAAAGPHRALSRTGGDRPMRQHEVTVVARYEVSLGGRVLASGSRGATASYTRDSQVLATTSAITEAEERAARAVAESVRLAILAELGAAPTSPPS